MHWVIFHFASGQAFFSGTALILAASGMATSSRRILRRGASIAILLGLVLIVASSTPLPYWLYAVAAFATMVWAVARWKLPNARWPLFVLWTAWVLAVWWELPYQIGPRLDTSADRRILIVADSITAGLGNNDPAPRWPQLLAQEHQLKVFDQSHVGETAASAEKRVRDQPVEASLVVLEIGGNDLLGNTSAGQFAMDLEELIQQVSTPGRQVVMFELPLPPMATEFGRIQRQVAARHHVKLLPKRVLMSILTPPDATVDTVHLTPVGQHRMANIVWPWLEPAFDRQ